MELLQLTTADGVELHGLLHPARASHVPPAGGACLFLHGAAGNFYASTVLKGILPALCDAGLAVLAINTRGHDVIAHLKTSRGSRRGGAAYEVIDECRHDVRGGIDALVARGFSRVVVMGHSLGALKGVYAQAHEPHERVAGIVAISPPRLSHREFVAGPQRDEFVRLMAQATELVAQGRGDELLQVTIPLPLLIAASEYLDKYGPAERYDVLNFAPQVTCPVHFIFGEREIRGSSPAFYQADVAIGRRQAKFRGGCQVTVVPGADHFYTGCVPDLCQRLMAWPGWGRGS